MPSKGPDTMARTLPAIAARTTTTEEFLSASGHFLSTSALQVERVFLSLQTLHPAFCARTFLWRQRSDQVEASEWPHGLENRPGYYDSPDFHVHCTRMEFRVQNPEEIEQPRCDPYGELKAEGDTDYVMDPFLFSDGTVNTFTIATKVRGGFPVDALDYFRDLTDLLAIIFERYAALVTASPTMTTYLGHSATQEVLRGQIRAGQGELIDAAILFADPIAQHKPIFDHSSLPFWKVESEITVQGNP